MKQFKIVSISFITLIAAVFCCNVFYMYRLYNSISQDIHREVIAAMADMDIDELWERVIVFREVSDTVFNTVKGSLKPGNDTIVMRETNDKGESRIINRRQLIKGEPFTNQMMTEMSDQMHRQMDGMFPVDVTINDSILRCRLRDRGIEPEAVFVEITDSIGNIVIPNEGLQGQVSDFDVFQIPYGAERRYSYRAYLTPMTRHILNQMSGVIITVFLLIILFAAAFGYLIKIVSRLRTLEEMKDDFVSNMTHELKTPISIAYSANDALLHYDAIKDTNRKEAYLNIANRQLKRLEELVENILAMSMERRKSMRFKKERIELSSFIRELADIYSMRNDKKINIEIEGDDGVTIEADRSHLTNVLNNITDNAIKYSNESVHITICYDNKGISIKDDGIGIPAKSLPYLFNKFYRVPQGNRQDVRGYGIGLYYVKSVLDKMGWGIVVKSKEGEGSIFTIKYKQDEK